MYYTDGFRMIENMEDKAEQLRQAEPPVYQSWRSAQEDFVHSFYKSNQQIEHDLMDMQAHDVTSAAFCCPVERTLKLVKSSGVWSDMSRDGMNGSVSLPGLLTGQQPAGSFLVDFFDGCRVRSQEK